MNSPPLLPLVCVGGPLPLPKQKSVSDDQLCICAGVSIVSINDVSSLGFLPPPLSLLSLSLSSAFTCLVPFTHPYPKQTSVSFGPPPSLPKQTPVSGDKLCVYKFAKQNHNFSENLSILLDFLLFFEQMQWQVW